MRHNHHLTLGARAGAVLLAMMGVAASANAQPRGITVFTDVDFNGTSQTFTQSMPDLRSVGLNDTISSIQVSRGEVWQVCADVNFRGRCQEISGTVADLRTMSFNDQISSMRLVSGNTSTRNRNSEGGYGSTGAVLYTNANYGGRSFQIRGDTPDLRTMGLNDQVSSIEIPNGESWQICVDIDYGNRCTVLNNSVPNLSRMGWNDQISSIRLVNNNEARYNRNGYNGQGALVFYDRPNFRGGSRTVSSGSNTDLIAREGSIRVNGGGVWRLCDSRGDCSTVDRDVPNISQLGLSDRITSVRPVTTSEYRRSR